MTEIVKVNGFDIEVMQYQDSWGISNQQVAEAFEVSEAAIRSQKSRNEFKEGVHFYMLQNATGNADATFWTKKGVITLGFKLRETPATIAFRDWASNYILKINPQSFTLHAIASMAQNLISLDEEIQRVKDDIKSIQNNGVSTSQELYLIQKAVNDRVEAIIADYPNISKRMLYPQIYGRVKEHFKIASYRDVPRFKINEAISVIQNLTIKIGVLNANSKH